MSKIKKNILIVGGSGFVGTNILKKIKEQKYNIFATEYKNKIIYMPKNITRYRGDLKNINYCNKITKSIDIVIMCAAISSGAKIIENDPMTHVDDNIIMNLNILKSSKKNKVKKFIFLSSNTVYPVSKKNMIEKDLNYKLFHKYFNVGWMKIFSEKLCEMYKNYMNIIIIRPANLYGPHDKFDLEKSKVIPSLIRKFETSNEIEVWGSGNDIKNFIYIEDFVEGLIKLIDKNIKFEIINISSSKSISIKKILYLLTKIYPTTKKIIFNKKGPSMIPFRKIDNKKFLKLTNYKFKFSFKNGLLKTINWYQNNFNQFK